MIDDRILCTDCRELVLRRAQVVRDDGYPATARPGDCLAAIERRRLDVHDQYGPGDVDLPRRCAFYVARPGASGTADPLLRAEYHAWLAERNGVRRGAAQRGIERARAAIEPRGERVA